MVRKTFCLIAGALVLALIPAEPSRGGGQNPSALPQAAVAEEPRPHYSPGEKWVYSRSGERYEIEFLRYEGSQGLALRRWRGNSRMLYLSPDGNPVKMVEDGKVVEDYGGEIPRLKFPMRIGVNWSGMYRTSAGVSRLIHAGVAMLEEVKVPAGTFRAFRIEITNQRLDRERPAYETVWFAPTTRSVVKHVSPELRIDIELLEYAPPQRGEKK